MTARSGERPPPPLLFEAVFRVSNRFELVVFDRLEPDERRALEPLRADPGFYGVLRPRSGGTVKAVGRDLALLLYTLRQPGRLPFFVREEEGEEDGLQRRIVALVADGVLEVDTGDGFVTGGEGLEQLAGGLRHREPSDLLGGLARSALRYAEALGLDDREVLAERLYAFGRLPLSPRWQRRFPDAAAVLAEVGGIDRPGWRRLRLQGTWICWQRGAGSPRDAQAPTFKLYVSPRPDGLAEAFGALPEALECGRALQLKVGASAAGLLRPDKLVVYFATEEDLFAAADLLGRRLDGLPVHGVPFSAPAGGDGLLSWGLDPPAARRLLSWRPRSSWRSWVVDRLAAVMVEAPGGRPQSPAWRSALARLELEGIDTATWTPDRGLWSRSSAGAADG